MILKSPRRTERTSYTELLTFTTCRMKWYWAYHQNLQKRFDSVSLFRGICGHLGLAALDNGLDPTQALVRWFNEQVDKETFVQEELDLLSQVVNSVNQSLVSYAEYYPRFKRIIGIETDFQVKIPRAPVDIYGVWDGIVEVEDMPGLYVLERKWIGSPKISPEGILSFTGSFRKEEQFDLDGQFAIYDMAAKARGYQISGVIVDQIKPPPKVPTQNKDGSMSRAKVGDWRTYEKTLIRAGLNPNHYQDMKDKLPECSEFRRDFVFRSDTEVKNYNEDLVDRMREMTAMRKRIHLADDRIRCQSCSYRELCIETLKGGDVDHLIQIDYVHRKRGTDVILVEETIEEVTE